MRIECPKCHRKYEVEEAYIPIGGGPVRCPNCSNVFGIYVEPMDIPMTPILEEEDSQAESAGTPFANPEFGESSFSPEYQPQSEPVAEAAHEEPAVSEESSISDLGDFSSQHDAGQNPFAASQEPMPSFDSSSYEEPSPSAPADNPFMNPAPQSEEQSMNDNPFAQPNPFAAAPQQEPAQPQSPFGDVPPFAAPQSEPAPAPAAEESNPFAQMQQPPQQEEVQNPFAQAPVNPFIQQQPQQQAPQKPALDTSAFMNQPVPPAQSAPQAPPVQNPFMQQPVQPAVEQPVQQPAAEPAPAKKVVGGSFMESIMQGYSLPANFNMMPENVQKLHKDAIKIARQLAKDILLYHKDTVDKGLAGGNLKDILNEEIEKSYKFYTQRVQQEICNSTNYFNEALNNIVAKGQKVF